MSTTTIPAFMIELDKGRIGPAFTLDVALQAAREAETAGRRATSIRRGPDIILDGDDLREALDN